MELVINDLIPENVPFIANVQGSGYYRVNYDDRNWRKLAEVLRTNKDWIHPLNRAQIICDVAHMSSHGHLDQIIADDVLEYFGDKEQDFVAIRAYSECVSGADKKREKRFKRNFKHY